MEVKIFLDGERESDRFEGVEGAKITDADASVILARTDESLYRSVIQLTCDGRWKPLEVNP